VVGVVAAITRDIEALAGGTDRETSVGGMVSKLAAARIVTRAGAPMVIADGARPGVLEALVAGEEIGTLFLPRAGGLARRKRWIAFFQKPAGALIVDDGAKRALCEGSKSLLAKGIARHEGAFAPGAVVSIRDLGGAEFGRGLMKATAGVVVHRDDLVIL
jgi:glutamate 5-kinase